MVEYATKLATREGATVMVWSSHQCFTRILDDPTKYGFGEKDVRKQGRKIWVDQLHPTSKMHRLIAEDMVALFNGVDAHGENAS